MPPITMGLAARPVDAASDEPTKKTEIGDLPESWQVVRLGEVAQELRSGITPKGGQKVYLKTGIPLIRSQNVLTNRLSLRDVAFISPDEHRSMIGSAVQPGDVLLNITGASIGRVTVVPDDVKVANVNQHVCRIRLARSADPLFLSYYLSTAQGQSQVMGSQFGSTRQGLNYGNVRAIRIPLPRIEEQRAIARVIETVQRTREARQRELSLERERKAALMEYLFTHGTRGEDSKQTEIGEIPESWQAVPLRTVCKSSAFGPRFGAELYNPKGNVAVLRTTDLDDEGNIDYGTVPFAQVELEKFKSHLLEPGDFLVSRSGTCGIASVFQGHSKNVLPGAFLIRFRLASELSPEFLRHYINSATGRHRVQKIASGAIQQNITSTSLLNFCIPLPPVPQQESVNLVAAGCHKKILGLERELQLINELFGAMLNGLMTGRLSAMPLTKEHQAQ